MFHNVPPVPRVKMERFGTFAGIKFRILRRLALAGEMDTGHFLVAVAVYGGLAVE